MDKKKSIINIAISLITKVVVLVFSLFTQSILVRWAGNTVNGLNSLYSSIIGFLSVADLGIGSAIIFSMYKPIVQGDKQKVSALYNLYRKVYFIIGVIILVGGLLITPAIPYLAKDYQDINSSTIYFTFILMLISVVLSYGYSSQSSLINAYKNNYVTTLISFFTTILKRSLQILVLFLWHSFTLYLVAMIVATLFEWGITTLYTKKHYKDIISTKEKVDSDTKKEIIKDTKAMLMHKIGTVLVNTIDSIIISSFVGVVVLGKYSNYVLIMSSMIGVLDLFFQPLTSVIGHLCAKESVEEQKKYFRFMYLFNFTIAIVFFLGYYAVIDNVVLWWMQGDSSLILAKDVSLIITINNFISFMRKTVGLYRDATGTFYYDRFKPIAEGVVNLVLSIAFVYWIGLVGVIVATIITSIFICHIVEPYVLYKHAFKQSPKKYYILNYSLMLVFGACLTAVHFSMQQTGNFKIDFVINGFIAVAIALVPIIVILCISKEYRTNMTKALKYVFGLLKFKKKEKVYPENPNKTQLNQALISQNSSSQNEENIISIGGETSSEKAETPINVAIKENVEKIEPTNEENQNSPNEVK